MERGKKRKALREKNLNLPTLLFPTDTERKILPLSSAFKAAIFSSFSIFTERRKGTKPLSYYLVHQTQLSREIPQAHSQGEHAETEPLQELTPPLQSRFFFSPASPGGICPAVHSRDGTKLHLSSPTSSAEQRPGGAASRELGFDHFAFPELPEDRATPTCKARTCVQYP